MKKLISLGFSSFTDIGILLLRLALGGLISLSHGYGKLATLLSVLGSGAEAKFPDPFGVGHTASLVLVVFAEFFCGLLLMIGLFTRVALVPLITVMGTAAFIIHRKDILGNGELALVYLVGFVTLFITGAGRFSVDSKLSERT